jgi:hypothetical protein
MKEQKKYSFFYRNGLSIVLLAAMLVFLSGQFYTGWQDHNEERKEKGQAELNVGEYFTSGHFISATFENWESEFLQMAIYVLLTVKLRQLGSSESKKLKGQEGWDEEEVDREPKPSPEAPAPVRKGGWLLRLYSSSLSIAFALLFLISFWLHFYGSYIDYNDEQREKGEPEVTKSEYITNNHFWFESFQNWQSEFLAVASIVILSIWLRQKGSPESKPVDASYDETGSS